MQIDDILKLKLKKRPDVSDHEWTAWEYKTFNMHRVVLVWQPEKAPTQYAKIPEIVRARVASCFKSSWWRGLGFGLIAVLPSAPDGVEACVDDIDTRENPKGTWQWSVWQLREHGAVIGAHMWLQGYLSSTYQQLVQGYESDGNKVATFKKDKDLLMKFLTSLLPFNEHEKPTG